MNIWVRLFGTVDGIDDTADFQTELVLRLSPALHISVYPTEQTARAAQEKYGGIVLEISAASLRGQIEGREQEGDAAVCLSRDDEETAPAARVAFVDVIFTGIPHRWNEEEMVARFDKSVPWFDELEKELGSRLHQ